MKKKILIVGFGSVGKRHAENFFNLDCDISVVEVNLTKINEHSSKFQVHAFYKNVSDAINFERFDGAVICSPTFFHPLQSLALIEAGIPVLVEKPLAINLSDTIMLKEDLKRLNGKLLLGYTWRWWEPLRILRGLVLGNKIGKVRHVHFNMSAHLADWHPWERYQDFFMSSVKLGGGALLDESHWIDIMIWIFGMPNAVSGKVIKLSELEIETDDNVDIFCEYEGLSVTIHLDLFGRPHDKSIRFTGENGSIIWTAEPNKIRVSNNMLPIWEDYNYDYQRNDMFVSLAKDFILLIDNEFESQCSIDDGINVLKIIEAVRQSSILNKTIQNFND